MTESAQAVESLPQRNFQYSAQTRNGQTLSGTMQASSVDEARGALQSMGLHVLAVEDATPAARTKPLTGEDFLAFNQQLAHLTGAGLPMEVGLRLIAEDLRNPRAASTVREIAAELERGKPLAEAIQNHAKNFPAMFSRVLAAGVAANNLPGLLLNLGRHLELVQQLRASLWRSLTYPASVLIALCGLMLFIGIVLVPRFEETLAYFGTRIPAITQVMFSASHYAPMFAIIVFIAIFGLPILWKILERTPAGPAIYQALFLRVPIVGGILRRGVLARWCSTMQLAVAAGLELPAALTLAGDAVALPGIRADSHTLREKINSGQPMNSAAKWHLLPPTISTTMQLGSDRGDLPNTLAVLAQMYQQQAESRIAAIPTVLMPALMVLLACTIGFIITALFVPMINLIQAVSAPISFHK